MTINSSLNVKARAYNGADWSALNSAVFSTAVPATSSNLAITEIMYNPPSPTGSELLLDKDEFEFVEFRNIGDVPVSLAGVRFTAGITFDFADSQVPFLNPGQNIVLARNLAAFRSRYGESPIVAGVWGATGTNFSNGGELVTVLGPGDAVITSFTYDDAAPWPVSPDGAGYSLTSRWTTGDYNSFSNWRASYVLNGTPGFEENDFPENLTLSNNVVSEGIANAVVGDLSALDPNPADRSNLVYSIRPGGNGSQFQIVGQQLRVGSIGLDYETAATRTILVRATDPGGLFVERSFVIQVLNVNESPTDLSLNPAIVNENSSIGTLVGTLSTVDPDAGETFVYELVAGVGAEDNSRFTILAGQVRTATLLDFESKGIYTIRIRSTDSGGLTVERAIPILVRDLPELNSIQVGNGAVQRSLVTSLSVTFDGITDLQAGAFVVNRRGSDGGPVASSFTSNVNAFGQTVATVNFSGAFTRGALNALVDGNYELRIDASKVSRSGFQFDGDLNGVAGGDHVFGVAAADRFFAHFGDLNGDRLVATAEFNSFRNTFGRNPSDPSFEPAFDFESNGVIGTSDFNEFRKRFGRSLGFA